jgi:outer membrane immunogenic protein
MVALAGAATAADLPRPAPAPYSQPAAFVPAYNWTGFYVGLNGGGGLGSSNWQGAGSFNVSGGLIGSTVGYNYQFGQAVAGIEGDVDWSGIKGSSQTLCPLGCRTNNSWLSTVRGRLGYAADRYMPYVTGGAAFGNIRAGIPGFIQNSSQTGWTLGAGLEAAVVGNWTAKVEYLYVDLGSFNCGLNCGLGLATDNVSFRSSILRAGLNYRF